MCWCLLEREEEGLGSEGGEYGGGGAPAPVPDPLGEDGEEEEEAMAS